MTISSLAQAVSATSYPGRGIIIGAAEDGAAVIVYFIMGRSENSRNRIFVKTDDGIRTQAHDESKMVDPSLIIYHPVRDLPGAVIVTNGDQTDTIRDHLLSGGSFESALQTREYEPDAPNFTPRISGLVTFDDEGFGYKLSILKALAPDGPCARYTFDYSMPVKGLGHFVHTYQGDGSPLPSFEGEPEPVQIAGDVDSIAQTVWNALNEDNRVSLYVRKIDRDTGYDETRIVNRHN